MLIDFLLSEYALGFSQGQVRVLDPARLCDDPRGLSGTEVNALGLAYELARQGHRVHIYSHFTLSPFALIPGHLYCCPLNIGQRLEWLCDIAVAFHDSTPLLNWKAGKKIVWHQTVYPLHSETMADEPVDLYISATHRNANHLMHLTPSKPWAVVPNGWDFGTYKPHDPVPGRLFYHTSPERGLHILLRALPLIRQRVPHAHLDIWCRLETAQGHHPQVWDEIQRGLVACKDFVTVHPEGGSRNQVLAALAKAQVLAYPSEPPMPCEVMPVSVMEACAIGVPVVTAPSDNFHEAFGSALMVTPEPPSAWLETFVRCVGNILEEPRLAHEMSQVAQLWAAQHTFAASAKRFLEVVSG